MQKPGLFGMNGFLLFLLTCCSLALRAQQPGNLILIDAENKQAFTIRVGDQLYASSGHGHLVLYHFKDSSYRLNFRMVRKTMAELVFPVTVHQKDLGFQLRSADSSWVLYNWQTKQTIRAVNEPDSTRILEMGVRREDGFSKLMAAVVNDTAVMYNTYTGNWFARDSAMAGGNTSTSGGQNARLPLTANPVPSSLAGSGVQNPQPQIKSADSSLVKNSTVSPNIVPLVAVTTAAGGKKGKAIPKQKTPDSTLTKTNTQASAAGQPSTANGQPNAPAGQPSTANGQPIVSNPPSDVSRQSSTISDLPTTASNKLPSASLGVKKLRDVNLKISRKMVFLDMGKDGILDTITLFVYFEKGDIPLGKPAAAEPVAKKKNSLTDSVTTANAQVKNNPGNVFVAGCGEMATDQDLDWLRSAILKANSEQDKITAASNAFALKCFSVSQVRVLASLLVSDKARYRLMDAARQHIADKDHFRELADMYTDKNFQKKFLAMADKRS